MTSWSGSSSVRRPHPSTPATRPSSGVPANQVDVATGILMVRHRVDRSAALELLRACGHRAGRPLLDLADDVVRFGALVGVASRPHRRYAYPPTPMLPVSEPPPGHR